VSIINFVQPSTLLSSLTEPQVVDSLILSIITATISTTLIGIFGVPLAYCLSRYKFPDSFLVQIIVIIPLVLPPLASGALLLGVFRAYPKIR
jgi:ABC-type sulfate transport system permease component